VWARKELYFATKTELDLVTDKSFTSKFGSNFLLGMFAMKEEEETFS